jgi:hypothetical protein
MATLAFYQRTAFVSFNACSIADAGIAVSNAFRIVPGSIVGTNKDSSFSCIFKLTPSDGNNHFTCFQPLTEPYWQDSSLAVVLLLLYGRETKAVTQQDKRYHIYSSDIKNLDRPIQLVLKCIENHPILNICSFEHRLRSIDFSISSFDCQ